MQGFCLPNDFSKATLKLRAKASDNRRGHRRHFAASFQSRSSEFQKSAFFSSVKSHFNFGVSHSSKIDGRTCMTLKLKCRTSKLWQFCKNLFIHSKWYYSVIVSQIHSQPDTYNTYIKWVWYKYVWNIIGHSSKCWHNEKAILLEGGNVLAFLTLFSFISSFQGLPLTDRQPQMHTACQIDYRWLFHSVPVPKQI